MTSLPTQYPCNSKVLYAGCCEPYHMGKSRPDSAEKLMRSRYSAYVVGNIDYIGDTHDPASNVDFDRDAAKAWSKNSEWLGLEIISTRDGSAKDKDGEVEFKAKYKREGALQTHHEKSTFKQINSRWYYIDGSDVHPQVIRTGPKIGPNDPCTCGSGKKYKKCCKV